MIQTVEAIIETTGKVSLITEVHLKENRRALVTILEESPKVFPKLVTVNNSCRIFQKLPLADVLFKIRSVLAGMRLHPCVLDAKRSKSFDAHSIRFEAKTFTPRSAT